MITFLSLAICFLLGAICLLYAFLGTDAKALKDYAEILKYCKENQDFMPEGLMDLIFEQEQEGYHD